MVQCGTGWSLHMQTAIDNEGKSPLAVCLECRMNDWSGTAKLLREAYKTMVSPSIHLSDHTVVTSSSLDHHSSLSHSVAHHSSLTQFYFLVLPVPCRLTTSPTPPPSSHLLMTTPTPQSPFHSRATWSRSVSEAVRETSQIRQLLPERKRTRFAFNPLESFYVFNPLDSISVNFGYRHTNS